MPRLSEEALGVMNSFPPFSERTGEWRYTEVDMGTLQMNIGLKCNLACKHCHVESSPARTEEMSRKTMEECLKVVRDRRIGTIDITGGAPELNPNYEWLIREAAATGAKVMTRSNLVVLEEAKYAHLPQLWADLGVVVIASLPHYVKKNTDKQRGEGAYDGVIEGLKKLNALGYGMGEGAGPDGRTLELDLVYNPGGAILPGDQAGLERDYKERLAADHGIRFDNLFAIANNPNGRFGNRLAETGRLEGYMGKLVGAFNEATLPTMMCRTQLSVGWDGRLYDCDFNQAAELTCVDGGTIAELAADPSAPLKREIAFGNHCYGCTAGAGSSCGGATA
ncbi:arsenosugar biosynthesis radical SAM (seleno)protein ArsS [Xiamenia xianingshaonis]|uniref:Arsenosugar biosynthesis radical SAM protein ArsS n=1 Tax=Xiamenia xianingshaonis TaxID=2682776 RepID=A0A9E6SUK4_9ACTN|nr:arsenosugar biosynthesis radical SAM (seleno)protein ArsS [Xiamenia xianingshaonis]NHM14625.1 radical SAM/Cys-rich domain protein [Xiamenia xianingshaonis]QTU84337.1 arsenosugar biosynthesis radical SAM protein ArsS [Xiamenia xianingshaonis]